MPLLFRRAVSSHVFYLRILFAVLVVSLIPLGLVGAVSVINTRSRVQNHIDHAEWRSLEQARAGFEIIFSQLMSTIAQFSSDEIFVQFELFPFGARYERVSGPYARPELPQLADYVMAKRRVLDRLRNLRGSSDYIRSVHFIDARKEIVLSDGIYTLALSSFPDRELLADMTAMPDPVRIEQRSVDGQDRVLVVYYRSLSWPENAFLVYLSVDALVAGIAGLRQSSDDSSFFLVDGAGRVLIDDDNLGVAQYITALLERGPSVRSPSVAAVSLPGESGLLVATSRSPDFGWTLVTAVEERSAYAALRQIEQAYLAFGVAVCLLVVIAALVGSRVVYRPLSALLTKVQARSSGEHPPVSGVPDEITFLDETLERSFAHLEKLQERVRLSLPAFRDRFISSLCRGHSLSDEEVAERFHYFELTIEPSELFVSVWDFGSTVVEPGRFGEWSAERVGVIDFIRNGLSLDTRSVLAEEGSGLLLCLTNGSQSDLQGLQRTLVAIHRTLAARRSVHAVVGLGRHVADHSNLARGYSEACQALRYAINHADADVLYFGDVAPHSLLTLTDLRQAEDQLVDALRAGDQAACRNRLQSVFHVLAKSEGSLHYEQVRFVYMRLLTRMLDLSLEIGVEMLPLERPASPVSLFEELSILRSRQEIVEWFTAVVGAFAEHVAEHTNTRHANVVHQVRQLAARDLAGATLEAMADEVGMTPNYVSRLMKLETGESFQTFITKARIERAKELLLSSSSKVKEIGRSIGYSNSYYFIRIFREHTGQTPGAFRSSQASSIGSTRLD